MSSQQDALQVTKDMDFGLQTLTYKWETARAQVEQVQSAISYAMGMVDKDTLAHSILDAAYTKANDVYAELDCACDELANLEYDIEQVRDYVEELA